MKKHYDTTQILLGIPEIDRRSEEMAGMTADERREYYATYYPEMAVVVFSDDDDE